MNNLKHYGVPGMRWGRRRGTTPAHSDRQKIDSLKKKKLKELSDDELKKIANRLELERRVSTLDKSKVSSGKEVVGKFMSSYGNQVVGGLVTVAAAATVKTIVSYAKKAS